MKSFADWTQEIAESNNHEPEAEKNSWEFWEAEGHGVCDSLGFKIDCRVCDHSFYVSDYIGPDEFDPDVSETWYCGRQPSCCP